MNTTATLLLMLTLAFGTLNPGDTLTIKIEDRKYEVRKGMTFKEVKNTLIGESYILEFPTVEIERMQYYCKSCLPKDSVLFYVLEFKNDKLNNFFLERKSSIYK